MKIPSDKKFWLIIVLVLLIVGGLIYVWRKSQAQPSGYLTSGALIDVIGQDAGQNDAPTSAAELKIGQWLTLPGSQIKFPVPAGWFVDDTGRQIYANPDDTETCKIEFDEFEWTDDFEVLKTELDASIKAMDEVSDFKYGEMVAGGQAGYFQDVTLPIGTSRAFYTLFDKRGVVVTAYYNADKDAVCPETWEKILNQIQWPEITPAQ